MFARNCDPIRNNANIPIAYIGWFERDCMIPFAYFARELRFSYRNISSDNIIYNTISFLPADVSFHPTIRYVPA